MRTVRSLPYGGLPNNHPPRTETPPQRPPWIKTPPGQRPLPRQRPPWTETPLGQRSLLDRDHPWTETPLEQRPPRQRCPWSCDLWCMLGQRPPCEQNHRQLWKHNLPATLLWAVIIDHVNVTQYFCQVNWECQLTTASYTSCISFLK